jgi:glyoxylase-like metal-dependent hydrolase (beta-lactamase superfamily II)
MSYEVFVSDGVPRTTELRLPDGGPIVSSPLASTLIYGQRDAVLVDPPFTREQTVRVGHWIDRSGKRLAYLYSTHGHGDHWFGTAQLLDRFPGAAVYATEGTIRLMRQQATTGREQTWDKDFPGLIPDSPVLAQPIPPGGFTKTTAAAHPYAVVARRQATTGHPHWALADASEAVAS